MESNYKALVKFCVWFFHCDQNSTALDHCCIENKSGPQVH